MLDRAKAVAAVAAGVAGVATAVVSASCFEGEWRRSEAPGRLLLVMRGRCAFREMCDVSDKRHDVSYLMI